MFEPIQRALAKVTDKKQAAERDKMNFEMYARGEESLHRCCRKFIRSLGVDEDSKEAEEIKAVFEPWLKGQGYAVQNIHN